MSPSATLETSGTVLEAGGAASVPLTVRNDRNVVDEYRFRVVGPLARWTTVEPGVVSVYPGDSATVTVLFRPPRSWEVRAGNAPYGVQVMPTQHPQDSVVAEDVVDVQAFWENSAELVPRTSEGRGGGRHRVAVDNRGNTPVTVQLVPNDPEERLHMVLGAPTLTVQPGTVQSADLRVRPRHRIWRGTQTAHPFTVELRPDGGPGTMLTGTHRQDPILPGWSPKIVKWLVVLGVVALLVLGAFVVTGALRDLVARITPCIQGAVVGRFEACQRLVGADPPQEQGGAGQDQDGTGQDQGGGDQGGGGEEGELEEISLELTVDAEPGEFGQDVREVEQDGTVFTSVVLRTSSGDEGVFLLSISGTPITEPLSISLIQDGEQEFSLGQQGIATNAGQEIQLDLRCDSADDELLSLTDSCEVTAELQGVAPQG
ncbi:hypothetical protein [Kocuria rhizosphaericola]|uniref:COG1470 family protein n=1 Tax=Kocuria rhizosphaericola TaxID=3376284 RepID=UPI00378C161D